MKLHKEDEIYCIETAMQYARCSNTWKKYIQAFEHALILQIQFLIKERSK